MPVYPPPAGTYTEQPLPTMRPGTTRASTNSATAERYRPRTYSHPPPTQPDPTLLGPAQTPYAAPAPSPYAHPIQTPYPQQEHYTTAPPPLPMPQPTPIYPQHQPTGPPLPSPRQTNHTQPPPRPPLLLEDVQTPRPSYSSHRSHHSHSSRRSKHSKHSRHSSSDSDDDRHESRHPHHHHHHHSHSDEIRAKIAEIDRRPTMGDSVMAFFGLIKSALGPSDR